jgi:hypothetical protein
MKLFGYPFEYLFMLYVLINLTYILYIPKVIITNIMLDNYYLGYLTPINFLSFFYFTFLGYNNLGSEFKASIYLFIYHLFIIFYFNEMNILDLFISLASYLFGKLLHHFMYNKEKDTKKIVQDLVPRI